MATAALPQEGRSKSPGYGFFPPEAGLSPVEADAYRGQHVYPPNIPWQIIRLADASHPRPPHVERLVVFPRAWWIIQNEMF